jgi:septal ring factor EnvC (AmiA/AmiB activator)
LEKQTLISELNAKIADLAKENKRLNAELIDRDFRFKQLHEDMKDLQMDLNRLRDPPGWKQFSHNLTSFCGTIAKLDI